MQDVSMIANTIEPGTMVGLFGDKTFGPGALPALETLLKTGKVSAFRVHLFWTKHADPPNAIESIRRAASDVERLHARYPGVACYVSPVCEYDQRNAGTVQKWAMAAKSAAPSCQVVLTPSGSGATPPGYPIERHGSAVRGWGTSTDGNSIWDADSAKVRNSGSEYALAWWPRCNLSTSVPKFPPSSRTAQTSKADIQQGQAVMKAPPPKPPITMRPPGCRSVRELTGKELWKTNAEDSGNGDPRSNKPLLISRARDTTLSIVSSDGKGIGCLKYYGTYSPYGPNWFRHYAGSCHGQSAVDLLHANGGNEWGYIQTGKECLLINLIRRTGNTR
jgi:hypothetical protein